jgi:hypothetical protein
MMRAARFDTVFMGIETPETEALAAMKKKQNLGMPVLDAVHALNAHGMEVVSGIIMGLDSDTPRTGKNILKFIEASQIPMLTINLLYALPRTALYARLAREGRLFTGEAAARRMSNVKFRMPYEQVVNMWFETISEAYEPARLFERFRYQAEHTFSNRGPTPDKVSWRQLKLGLQVVARTLWYAGVTAEWRNEFWALAWPLLRQGRIEDAMHIGVVVYHLIRFTRALKDGEWEACFYADPNRSRSPVAV